MTTNSGNIDISATMTDSVKRPKTSPGRTTRAPIVATWADRFLPYCWR